MTAGIIGFAWDWVSWNLVRRAVDRDVATELLGAAGKAEGAFNQGLARRHRYGYGHPPSLKQKILARAYRALSQRGVEVGPERRETVAAVIAVAGVLTPLVDDFYAKVAERRKAREMEQLRRAGEERFKATHGRF